MMYETRVGRIDTDITTYWMLAKMSRVATKLYNTALWNARDTWDKTGKIPSGFDLQKVVLQSPYHDMLPAHTYQHTAHQVWNGFKTWFKLRKTDKTANPPGFRPKDKLSSLLFTEYGFKVITKNCILITLGTKLKEELNYKNKRLTIRIKWGTEFPERYTIKELEIIPRDGYFDVHAKLILPEPKWRTKGQLMFGDLGQYNPIVTEDEKGVVDIFKGGKILSTLHYYNKEKARVISEVTGRTNGKKKWSKALDKMSKRGTSQVQHSLHSLANKIVDLCLERDVRKLVVGDLGGIKKEKDGTGKNWNRKSNQNWQQLPIRRFVTLLRYKLARHGIQIEEVDEHGTSKGRCSLCGCEDRSKLHRIHRGMFYCENCTKHINADVNGVGNIKSRYLHQIGKLIKGSSGSLADPVVWRWDNHLWKAIA